jgi:hypothetical protein
MQASKTMCEGLGHEFLPYLHTLMKPLLERAQLKCDYGIALADSMGDVQYFDDMGYFLNFIWLFSY